MAVLGYVNQLKIVKDTEFGVYLDGGEMGEILLPNRYAPSDAKTGEIIEVFVYLDSEDRPIATTEKPKLTLGRCAMLEVVDVNKVGAFLDWGLSKDILVPYAEQSQRMRKGKSYLVTACLDKRQGKIIASSKLDRHLNEQSAYHKSGQKVEIIIDRETDLGYKVVVDHRFLGLLYSDEAPPNLKPGETLTGFVKNVRPDGKLDITTRAAKPANAYQSLSEKILQHLHDNGGSSTITDKSSPHEILQVFGVSKGSYKKTLGHLYKLKKIHLSKEKISLV